MADNVTEDKNTHEKILKSMATPEFTEDLIALLKIRAPIIYLTCSEEKRMLNYFKSLSAARGFKPYTWDCYMGMRNLFDNSKAGAATDDITDPDAGLELIIKDATDDSSKKKTLENQGCNGKIYLLLDFYKFIEEPTTERRLKRFAQIESMTTIIVTGPHLVTTPCLENLFSVIDFPYPNDNEILGTVKSLCKAVRKDLPTLKKDIKDREHEIVGAVNGLTLNEAQNALAKSVVKHRKFDIPTILAEKKMFIRRAGVLEFFDSDVTMNNVGGLRNLVRWLKRRKLALDSKAIEYGLPPLRGVMLLGVPGAGKSLISKAIASMYEMPLLRLDFGALFKSHVGESEATARSAIKLAEAMAPCVTYDTKIQLSSAEKYQVQVTVGSLFDSAKNHYYYENEECIAMLAKPLVIDSFCVETDKIIKSKMVAIVRRKVTNKKVYKVLLSSGKTVKVSEDHKFLSLDSGKKNDWRCIKNLGITCQIMTIDGIDRIAGIEKVEDIEYVYDPCCIAPNNYISNGIVSHNCAFWIDEVEKGISGTASSNMTDGGTTDRVVSTFLTWLQEKKSNVFVVCTANDHEKIPPAFMRAGRFDEVFFVGFPNLKEREQIFGVLISKYKRDPSKFDLEKLAAMADYYTGAEIEKAITLALFEAFYDKGREPTTDDILDAMKTFNPQYFMRQDYFDTMEKWAEEKGCVLASDPMSLDSDTEDEFSNIDMS